MELDSLDTFFLNKTGNIATFYLKKKKRIDQFISGEPTKNRTNAPIVMEHDHIRHNHRPTWPHANSRPYTPMSDNSDFDDKLRK
jgi:hypothetical protein